MRNRSAQMRAAAFATIALVAHTEGLSAAELADELEFTDASALRSWLGRLLDGDLVEQIGRTSAAHYFVMPTLLRESGLGSLTTFDRVQPHRLCALILEDLERFPDSGRSDIHRRIGLEIHEKAVGHPHSQRTSSGGSDHIIG